MINGIGHYDFNYQANHVHQRSSDIRFSDPSVMTKQETQSESIDTTTSGSLTCQYQGSTYHYTPATTVWNLNKTLKKFGIPVPAKYCNKMWCVKDIAGYMAAGFSWAFIIVGEFLIIMNCLSFHRNMFIACINIIITFILAMLAFISHCKCMFSDPGTLPRGTATEENIAQLDFSDGRQVLKCVKCDSIKPDRAHHCSTCKRCIRKMDHHCPWVNNCVGEYNQKFFVLFTGYVFVMSCYGFVISLASLLVCVTSTFEGCFFSMTATLVMSICLMMESLMFGLFTAIMFGTQMCSICKDQTGIESLKKEKRKRLTCKQSLREVFGGKFTYKWFSPFHNYVDNQYIGATDSV